MRAANVGWLFSLLVGCQVDVSLPTPLDRFYFPTALTHLDNPARPEGNGVLLVASTNFDKRFSSGSLVALNLDALPLPAFGSTPSAPVTQLAAIRSTALDADGGSPDAVLIAPFAGQVATLALSENRYRVFVPTRSERQRVHAVELTLGANGPTLSCFNSTARDCGLTATSLNTFEQAADSVPRAPGTFGVALRARVCTVAEDCGGLHVCRAGRCFATPQDGGAEEPAADVLVTHITQADTPLGTGQNPRGYLVKLRSESMEVTTESFLNLGLGATHGVAAGRRWNFVSGRFVSPLANLVRIVDTNGTVISSGIESVFRVADARAIALSSDERRVFLLGRSPDTLLVATVEDGLSDAPKLQVVRGSPLPEAPSELVVLPRTGRGDLLAITCTNAGVLVLYDDDVGDVVVQVPGIGIQPFGVTVDRRGVGARLFISNFQDGRVAVLDIPDLNQPQGARVVAHLGRQQLCLIRATDPSCVVDGGAP